MTQKYVNKSNGKNILGKYHPKESWCRIKISEKIESKANRGKDGNTIEKGTSHQKDTTIINFYEPNNKTKPNQCSGK